MPGCVNPVSILCIHVICADITPIESQPFTVDLINLKNPAFRSNDFRIRDISDTLPGFGDSLVNQESLMWVLKSYNCQVNRKLASLAVIRGNSSLSGA